MYFSYVIINLIKDHNFRSLQEIQNYFFLFTAPIYSLFVPLLSMLMDFLWLAYRKYEHKYTMIRWTWYIVIRILVNVLSEFSLDFPIPVDYQIYNDFINVFYGIFPIIDFIQYVYYARKFYLHLKSREKEIRLFYFDKKAYLDSKYLRIHFKIATILVVNAIFFSILQSAGNFFTILTDIPDYIPISQQLNAIITIVYGFYADFIANLSLFISELLFIFNYLYIFIVVVYKSYRDRQKLKNINNYIKPIMKQYHDNYYNRYTNYA